MPIAHLLFIVVTHLCAGISRNLVIKVGDEAKKLQPFVYAIIKSLQQLIADFHNLEKCILVRVC